MLEFQVQQLLCSVLTPKCQFVNFFNTERVNPCDEVCEEITTKYVLSFYLIVLYVFLVKEKLLAYYIQKE